ncbi:MAG: FemAB family PEP-CTERM system-associated protein [Gemmatimonadaceae bacterium]|nr:FemAB family PEP-CTERM system-associated protein [Gemmatimonadaceae bacterium]
MSGAPAITGSGRALSALRIGKYAGGDAEWDAFVRAQRGWTHFHLHGWRRVMERALGHECIYLCAHDAEGALEGILPLVRVKSALFGHYLVSLPFLNYGGPLGSEDAVRALASHATCAARRDEVTLLELRSRHEQPLDLPVSHRKLTTVLDLVPNDADAVFRAVPRSLRNRIRKAQRSGVTVRFGAEQVAAFHRVFSRHMRFLGTPTHGRKLFDEIAATFPEDSLFACAYIGETPVAAGAGFFWDGEFEITWASALREYDDAKPNMALYWALIERATNAGCHTFNFGRSTPDSGTHEFKKHWGSRDEPLYWYDFSPTGEAATTPSPKEGGYAWGPRIWKKLPLALTRLLGPRIVRFIP